jgi:tripartite ATP-independent transporter DctM subunit
VEIIPLLLIIFVCSSLLAGYPVAFTLAGVSIIFALICSLFGIFDLNLFKNLPIRIFGIMENQTLLAVPLFVFMGVVLEKSGIAAKMLQDMAKVFAGIKGGLGISIVIVGALLAASTGIVGATVVTMGLMSLPALLKDGYDKKFSSGLVAATGTLGQIIPPSIALVLLGDVMSTAYASAQNMIAAETGDFSPMKAVSVGDLFVGALLPGLIICILFLIYTIFWNRNLHKNYVNVTKVSLLNLLNTLLPPILLIFMVLGSIIFGIATPTEAAGVGAIGSILICLYFKKFNIELLKEASRRTALVTTMVFTILIGASIFSLIFRGVGGDELISLVFEMLPGGKYSALFFVMLMIFLLGFILDFIEICYVFVPLIAPPLLMMGFDPVWLGIMLAINLQTSFLTPPFGFSLFYLRGVADKSIRTIEIYKGVIPFIAIQLLVLLMVILFPGIVL